MTEIRLDKRLSAVASMVRQGSVLADIGTDHAYLVCNLLQRGIISRGIAADLRRGPLDNAEATVKDCGLEDKVQLILSDGLEKIPENSCDDIVIAGMGGILIAEILSKTEWVRNENIRIITQPMTHAEVLREFLCCEGFTIDEEKAVTDGVHCYCVLSSHYSGEKSEREPWYYYLGELINNSDSETKAYAMKTHKALKKKADALISCGKEDTSFTKTVKEIERKIKEAGLWQE